MPSEHVKRAVGRIDSRTWPSIWWIWSSAGLTSNSANRHVGTATRAAIAKRGADFEDADVEDTKGLDFGNDDDDDWFF